MISLVKKIIDYIYYRLFLTELFDEEIPILEFDYPDSEDNRFDDSDYWYNSD